PDETPTRSGATVLTSKPRNFGLARRRFSTKHRWRSAVLISPAHSPFALPVSMPNAQPLLNMSRLRILASLFVILSLTGCGAPSDPSLQTAVDELTRLDSYANTGLNYTDYQSRLLTTKANIDVALQKTNDSDAKERIEDALDHFLRARDRW